MSLHGTKEWMINSVKVLTSTVHASPILTDTCTFLVVGAVVALSGGFEV